MRTGREEISKTACVRGPWTGATEAKNEKEGGGKESKKEEV